MFALSRRLNIFLSLVTILLLAGCIKPFTPNIDGGMAGLIVIEGDILLNDTTRISITRTTPLSNDSNIQYVDGATVWVENSKGEKTIAVKRISGATITYLVNTIGLNTQERYRLKVSLAHSLYESDLLDVYTSPEIDSIGFTVDTIKNTMTIYANTQDATGNSRYYKWNYTEDWEFTSKFYSPYEYNPLTKRVREIMPHENRYYCWNSGKSTDIIIATSEKLTQNRIYQAPITSIAHTDHRINHLYSIELSQMVITKEAYKYWDNVKKNSDKLGGLFSPNPSEMKGNIYSIDNPNEVVIGYISAAVVAKRRVFISADEIKLFKYSAYCIEEFVDQTNNIPFPSLWDRGLDIVLYNQGPPSESLWVSKFCVDCRLLGTKKRPDFWPNDHV